MSLKGRADKVFGDFALKHARHPIHASKKAADPSHKVAVTSSTSSAELLVQILAQYGVRQIFGVPGEANPNFMLALQAWNDNHKDKQINFILTRHEQGAAFMAYGVSKAQEFSGNNVIVPGVCLSTEGPGATNLITGIACANLDKVPLIAITGQVAQYYKRGFQNIDVIQVMEKVTKWSISINDQNFTSEIVSAAFRKALTPPYGAVHIELPTDVAGMYLEEDTKDPLHAELWFNAVVPQASQIQKVHQLLTTKYKKPILLVGPNVFIRTTGPVTAWDAITQFANKTNIGVVVAPGGKGAIDPKNPLYLYALNFTPYDWSSYALLWADVVVAVGYDQAEFGPGGWNYTNAPIISINNFEADVQWSYQPVLEVIGDIGSAFAVLNELTAKTPIVIDSGAQTMYKFVHDQWKATLTYQPKDLKPHCVFQGDICAIAGKYMADHNGLIILDSGAHQTWVLRNNEFSNPANIISSNCMASMGVALPLALGYAMENQRVGDPAKKILVISGDGGFMMNVQELVTVHQINKVFPNVKIVVMVWDDSALGYVEWAEQQNFGTHFDLSEINPDFELLGNSCGWTGLPQVTDPKQLLPTLEKAFASPTKSALFGVKVDTSQNVKFSDWLCVNVTKAAQDNLGVTLPPVDLQVGRFA